jgi:hypothetical protein
VKAEPNGPAWIRSLFGQHVFSRVKSVSLAGRLYKRKPRPDDLPATLVHAKFDLHKGIENVIEESGLRKLTAIENLNLSKADDLRDLSSISSLGSLKILAINDCKNFESLDGLDSFSRLEQLFLRSPTTSLLRDVTPLKDHSMVEFLYLSVADGFSDQQENWKTLSTLPKLKYLVLKSGDIEFPNSNKGRFVANPNIEHAVFVNVDPGLEDLEGFEHMPKLKLLNIQGSSALRSLNGLEQCTSLELLKIKDCPNLEDTSAIKRLTALPSVEID